MKILFWICFSTLLYIYFGYPLLLTLLSTLFKRPVDKGDLQPTVSVIIPAYNEEKVIAEKIKNIFAIDYPKERFEVIIASDGSTDRTADIAKEFENDGARLLACAKRRGKPAVLNEVIPKARGEIIVFSDASSFFKPDAVRKLVRNFEDGEVGCVCGDYKFGYDDQSLRGQGEGLFVKYELFLKKQEAQLGSVLGLHGAIYAIRKNLFQRLPAQAINDDYIIPARIVAKGFRSVFESEAVAYEKEWPTLENEFSRRVRIAAGNWQQLKVLKFLLNPLRGMAFLEFVSHKVLRTLTPFLLLAMLISSRHLFLTLQLWFYTAAFAGYILEKRGRRFKTFCVPFYFCFSNLAVAVGFWKFLFGKQEVKWRR
ncbi:MAG: glycosyltransferase family 2 protein [Candidatus Omnitrophota bacterium]